MSKFYSRPWVNITRFCRKRFKQLSEVRVENKFLLRGPRDLEHDQRSQIQIHVLLMMLLTNRNSVFKSAGLV